METGPRGAHRCSRCGRRQSLLAHATAPWSSCGRRCRSRTRAAERVENRSDLCRMHGIRSQRPAAGAPVPRPVPAAAEYRTRTNKSQLGAPASPRPALPRIEPRHRWGMASPPCCHSHEIGAGCFGDSRRTLSRPYPRKLLSSERSRTGPDAFDAGQTLALESGCPGRVPTIRNRLR
jgi:hypothetical protein